jgi:uncharacterized protein (DUF1697 family)
MRYVALLRGINVGGKTRVEMAKLKVTFEQLAFRNVVTYINSGNVIFDTTRTSPVRIATDIEAGIQADFGLDVKVVVLNQPALETIEKAVPKTWVNDQKVRTDVLFLWRTIDSPKVLDNFTIKKGIDSVKYVPGAILWHIDRKDASRSGLSRTVGTDIYKQLSIRNANTLRKLVELMKR